jgi:ribosomal-protein-alanine N-acetyltransferase
MAGRTIRPMVVTDLERVAEIEQGTFSLPWSMAVFTGQLRRETTLAFVCELDSTVVGYLIADMFVDVWHIMNLAVDEPFRRQHIAAGLLEAYFAVTEQHAHRGHTLEVRASNTAAVELYRSFGFFSSGVRPGYYTDDKEDAVIMWKGWEGDTA